MGDYPSLEAAALVAAAGDTILILNGVYNQREDITALSGTATDPIYILAETRGSVIYRGGTEAWHLTDCTHLVIDGFIYEQQTANGVNIDDGGSYETPSQHITIRHCIFRDMNVSGNHDLLKLSGLDDFTIHDCDFINGSTGGSGIDMVGCHRGMIRNNYLDDCGTTGIQAKGGTQFITITRNTIKNLSERGVNLGGSTGLSFFRPPLPDPIVDAFEAADLDVVSNIFIGSRAPIAYVGCVRVKVLNNTIYYPDNWVMRILQENTTAGFLTCGINDFRNNIIYLDRDITEVNIGPDTDEDRFIFSNNVWYNEQDPGGWSPQLPVTDVDQVIADPLFVDAANEDFHLDALSPAIEAGIPLPEVDLDYDGVRYYDPPSSGAYEGNDAILAFNDLAFDILKRSGAAQLLWSGYTDRAIYSFEVERSTDGLNWELLERIEGLWPAGQNIRTSWTDQHPIIGRSYYRIQYIDEAGKKHIIGMRPFYYAQIEITYRVMDQSLLVQRASDISDPFILHIYNRNGQKLYSAPWNTPSVIWNYPLNEYYIINIKSENFNSSELIYLP